jgi:moderate conductance mechanosensitive channel
VSLVLAQISDERIEAVCGPSQAFWLCEATYRATENQLLARIAGTANIGLRILVIIVVAFLVTRLARAGVRRFAAGMEKRIHQRLARSEARGTLTDTEQYRKRRLQRLHAITGVMQGLRGRWSGSSPCSPSWTSFGISLQPVLAGAGLLGIVVGFGAQQFVRDVLAGIAMLIEDQYGVGDWINVDGEIGQVERVGLRTTSFRDLDGIQWHVLNGYIQRVGNLSQEWGRMTFDIPVALDTDVPTAKAVITRVATELTEDPVWSKDIIGPHEIWGVQDFGPEGIKIRCVIPTRPMANWDIKRQMRERINHAFNEAGIRQPGVLTDIGGREDARYAVRHLADDEVARRPATRPGPGRRGRAAGAPDRGGAIGTSAHARCAPGTPRPSCGSSAAPSPARTDCLSSRRASADSRADPVGRLGRRGGQVAGDRGDYRGQAARTPAACGITAWTCRWSTATVVSRQ